MLELSELQVRLPVPADVMQLRAAQMEFAWDGFELTSRSLDDPKEFCQAVRDEAAARNLAPGRVPSRWEVAVLDGVVVGRVSTRLTLNGWLRSVGGHIGYGVRPKWRRQGVATRLLRHGVAVLGAHGTTEALVTCDSTNLASTRLLEKAGARFDRCVEADGRQLRHYWMDTPSR